MLHFTKDNITLLDCQAFDQITNCNKLSAGRHHDKSEPAALPGNQLQIFYCCFAKTAPSLAILPLKDRVLKYER